jgi:DNA-binding MarR family transcriptional regulator
MARRLDAERLQMWRLYRRSVADIEVELAEELGTEADVALDEFEVLSMLDAGAGHQRVQTLATTLGINRSTMTRLLDRMTAKGWISREPASDDGRGIVVILSAKGRRVFLRVRPIYRRAVQRHFARHLTDTDVAALRRILHKIVDLDG